MRLAVLAILVSILIAYANHMVRVGVVSRREAARFLPELARPLRHAEMKVDRDQRLHANQMNEDRAAATATRLDDAIFIDWSSEDGASPSSSPSGTGRTVFATPGYADTLDDR